MLSQLENRSTRLTLSPRPSPAQPESSSSLAPSLEHDHSSPLNSHRQPEHGHPDDKHKHQPRSAHQQHQTPVEPRLQSMIIYVNRNVSLKSFLHFLLSNCGFTLRTSINLLLIILFLLSPCILAVDGNDSNIISNNNLNKDTNNNDNNNNDNNINNEISKENLLTSSSLGNLDNFEDDFSSSSMSHSRPVLLSSKLPVFPSSSSSSSLLSQSKSYSPITSSSLGSPLQSSSSPSSVSPDSYSILSSNPTQLSHYLQTKKSLPIKQSSYKENSQEGDFQSLFHRIARRSSRPYDVPQIECPSSEDGIDRFACPSADRMGRYRCIEDHVLCNGFYDCPNGEDEDRQSCMFYKTTKAHLDVLADAMLRMVRGRF